MTILGSGAPPPNLLRSAPSLLLEENNRRYLFDCGEGTTAQLQRGGVPLKDVANILFTHLHADHSLGYGQLIIGGWIAGRRSLRVFGPPGIKHLHQVLVDDLYRDDIAYRLDLGRSPDGLLEEVDVNELTGTGLALRDAELTITHFPVVHSIATLAFRIESRSGSVVISGDTAYHEALAEFARGADLLIHDATLAPALPGASGPGVRDVSRARLAKGHTTPEEAAQIAALAGVRCLVLTHLLPMTDSGAAVISCRSHFGGVVIAAEDLMQIKLPELQFSEGFQPDTLPRRDR